MVFNPKFTTLTHHACQSSVLDLGGDLVLSKRTTFERDLFLSKYNTKIFHRHPLFKKFTILD